MHSPCMTVCLKSPREGGSGGGGGGGGVNAPKVVVIGGASGGGVDAPEDGGGIGGCVGSPPSLAEPFITRSIARPACWKKL